MFHKIYTESKFKSEDYGRIRKEEFERFTSVPDIEEIRVGYECEGDAE